MTGRPRTFDEAEVLERAMDLFWRRGYEATGLSELTETMGIGRQSLYSTFGDKRQLYLRALEHYLQTRFQEVRAAFDTNLSPIERLRTWLNLKVSGVCSATDGARGCFAINSVMELCPDDEEVVKLIQSNFGMMIQLVAETIAEGQAAAEIRSDKDAMSLAQFLMTGSGGLIVLSKLQLPGEVGASTVEFLPESVRAPAN